MADKEPNSLTGGAGIPKRIQEGANPASGKPMPVRGPAGGGAGSKAKNTGQAPTKGK